MSDIRSGRENSVSVDPTLVYESLIDDISRTIVLELVVAIQGLSKVRSLKQKTGKQDARKALIQYSLKMHILYVQDVVTQFM